MSRRTTWPKLAVVIASVATGSVARAQEPTDTHDDALSTPEPSPSPKRRTVDFTDRPFAVGAAMGFGTPVGLIGLVADYSPIPYLAVGAGLGTNAQGLQAAAFLRARPFIWSRPKRVFGLSLGGAYATGPYKEIDPRWAEGWTPILETPRAHWAQVDIGFELRNRNGFQMLVALGEARMLNPSSLSCSGGVCTRSWYWLPTVAVVVGSTL